VLTLLLLLLLLLDHPGGTTPEDAGAFFRRALMPLLDAAPPPPNDAGGLLLGRTMANNNVLCFLGVLQIPRTLFRFAFLCLPCVQQQLLAVNCLGMECRLAPCLLAGATIMRFFLFLQSDVCEVFCWGRYYCCCL
jgi:hypothetical protein